MSPEYRIIDTHDWMTVVILMALLAFTMGKYFYQTSFNNFIVLPFNNKYIYLYNKKGKLLNWFHLFMVVFQLLNFSLFFFLAQNILLENTVNEGPLIYLAFIGILVLFHIIKIAMQLMKGYIFNTQKFVKELIFNKLSYLNHSSLFVFIANVLIIYVFGPLKSVVFITIFMIVSINFIGLFNLLKNHQKLIFSHLFYFILYLCALEIAPLLILGSYLKD